MTASSKGMLRSSGGMLPEPGGGWAPCARAAAEEAPSLGLGSVSACGLSASLPQSCQATGVGLAEPAAAAERLPFRLVRLQRLISRATVEGDHTLRDGGLRDIEESLFPQKSS